MNTTAPYRSAADGTATDLVAHDDLTVAITDRIAVVTLNRPERRNAMTLAMWHAIGERFDALGRDPAVRAVLLTGAGRDFCAGADIAEFAEVRDDATAAATYDRAVDAACDAIAGIPKPVIAVVDGHCLGGGAALAMACDFRYASPKARFGIPAARLSIVYGVAGSRRLLALVGLSNAKRILFEGASLDAGDAHRIGLVDHVATDERSTMADALAFAGRLSLRAPLTIAGTKAILEALAADPAVDPDGAGASIAAATSSADHREGRAAFAAKRDPVFKGS